MKARVSWFALLILAAGVLAPPNPALAKSACSAERYGDNLVWWTRGYAISPDSQYLYFSYQFFELERNGRWWRRKAVTRKRIGRYTFANGTVKLIRSSNDFHFDRVAVSSNGRYLAMRVGRPPRIVPHKAGRVRFAVMKYEEHIEIFDLRTKAVTKIFDKRGYRFHDVFFSADSKQLYYVQHNRGTNTTVRLTVFDLKAQKRKDVYPNLKKTMSPSGLDFYYSNNGIYRLNSPRHEPAKKRIYFSGRQPIDLSVLSNLSQEVGIPVNQLKIKYLYYYLDLKTRKIVPHALNAKSLRINAEGTIVRGLEPLDVWVSKKTGATYFRSFGDTQQNAQIYRFWRRRIETYLKTPKMFSEFEISPDERWVVYSYDANAVKTPRILDQRNGKWTLVDFRPSAKALIASPLCAG